MDVFEKAINIQFFELTAFCKKSYLAHKIENAYKKAIAQFRVRSHKLAIETGRHQRPKVPVSNRLCEYCNSACVDDEIHFLTSCHYHNIDRITLYNSINKNDPIFKNLNPREKITYILTNESQDVTQALGKFLYSGFRKRQ